MAAQHWRIFPRMQQLSQSALQVHGGSIDVHGEEGGRRFIVNIACDRESQKRK